MGGGGGTRDSARLFIMKACFILSGGLPNDILFWIQCFVCGFYCFNGRRGKGGNECPVYGQL